MKKYALIFIAIIIVAVVYISFSRQDMKPPAEHRLSVIHVPIKTRARNLADESEGIAIWLQQP
jgi:hypothetical protein